VENPNEYAIYRINKAKEMKPISNKKTRTQELLEGKVWDYKRDGKKLTLEDVWDEIHKPSDETHETHD